MSRNITVTLREWDESFEISAQEFIIELQKLLETVPGQFKNIVVLEFNPYAYDNKGEISLSYVRAETVEEQEEREKREANYKSDKEARERATLAQLKAKYENRS